MYLRIIVLLLGHKRLLFVTLLIITALVFMAKPALTSPFNADEVDDQFNIPQLRLGPSTQSTVSILYGVDVVNDSLWFIDKTNGMGQLIGPTGVDNLVGLACSQTTNKLYAVDASFGVNSKLFELDAKTGVATVIGDTGFDAVKGLTYDSENDVLYAITYLNELLTLNPATGSATLVGHPGTGFLDSLTYHSRRQELDAADINTDTLYHIDPVSGSGQPAGVIGFINVSGLAYDANLNILYGAARGSGQLITLNVDTGVGTVVGTMPNTGFNGLAACAVSVEKYYLPLINR